MNNEKEISLKLPKLTPESIVNAEGMATRNDVSTICAVIGGRFSRLLKLQALNAPEIIIQNECRMLATALEAQEIARKLRKENE